MRKTLFLALLVLLCATPLVSAEALDIYAAESMTMSLDIAGDISMVKTGEPYRAEYIKINLSFIPADTRTQSVDGVSFTPEAQQHDSYALFRIEDPAIASHSFAASATVTSRHHLTRFDEKVPYPPKVPSSAERYLESSELIDSDNQAIINTASRLAEGEDDLLRVLHTLGDWTRQNINYSLETYTADVTQKASWVLEERTGVCDEITALFIAMSRSLGIPVRYVSGVAYTNYQGINDWGPHAWAEVYVPEHGWIPYDVTYGQFGFTDASHIALKRSLSAGSSSVNYEWKGRNINMQAQPLDIDTSMLSRSGKVSPRVKLSAKPLKERVGFNSSNLIELSLKNPNDYYVMTTLLVGRTKELEIEGNPRVAVLLAPGEEKKLYRRVTLQGGFEEGYRYTIPFFANTVYNATAETTFIVREDEPVYSKEEIRETQQTLQQPDTRSLVTNLSLECAADANVSYVNESIGITCRAQNGGNRLLTGVNICLDECRSHDLGIGQTVSVSFNTTLTGTGMRDVFVTATHEEAEKRERLRLKGIDRPRIDILSLDVPGEVGFSESFEMSVRLKKNSYATPRNVTVRFHRDGHTLQTQHATAIEKDHNYKLTLQGKHLAALNTSLGVEITWQGRGDETYHAQATSRIRLKNPNLAQRLILWMRRIESAVYGFFGAG